MNIAVKLFEIVGADRPIGNAVVQLLRPLGPYFFGKIVEDATEGRGFAVVVSAGDAARQKQLASAFAHKYRLEIRHGLAAFDPLQLVVSVLLVLRVQNIVEPDGRNLVLRVAHHLAPCPVDEDELAVEGDELYYVAGVVHQILQLPVGARQRRFHAESPRDVVADQGERHGKALFFPDQKGIDGDVANGPAFGNQRNFAAVDPDIAINAVFQ